MEKHLTSGSGPWILLFALVASAITAYAAPPDRRAPTVPTGLVASAITTSGFTVAWSPSTDNVGVTGYEVFRGGVSLGTTAATSLNITGLSAGTAYSMTVRARDAAANWSAQSTALNVTTTAVPDTTPPSVPAGLVASDITSTSFTLRWTASTDNVGVTAYEVFRGGVSLGTTAATSLNITGLSAGTAYSMTVRARDAAANWSAQSAALSVTTSVAPLDPFSISAGENDVVIAKGDGTVWAWGSSWGPAPVRVGTVSTATRVASGSFHTLILLQNGTVLATGNNSWGQLSDGSLTTPISGFTGVSGVAAGRYHSLAVKSDGTLFGWGNNQYGQVGSGNKTFVTSPARLGRITGITQVAAGLDHSLALKSDGTVLAWGYNGQGQVGNGTTVNLHSSHSEV